MNELTRLANKYESDKGTATHTVGHHGPRLFFTEVYDEYFLPLKDAPITIMEIGVSNGPSMKMWTDYFTKAKIIGVDIHPDKALASDRVIIEYMDQSKRDSINELVDKVNDQFDIIIDDGSHVCEHQMISFATLFKHLKPGGQYWIEDLHTSDTSVWKEGSTLYGYDMSGNTGLKNSVLVLNTLRKTGTVLSPFMTQEERKYIDDNVAEVKMWDLGTTIYGRNVLALIKKK